METAGDSRRRQETAAYAARSDPVKIHCGLFHRSPFIRDYLPLLTRSQPSPLSNALPACPRSPRSPVPTPARHAMHERQGKGDHH